MPRRGVPRDTGAGDGVDRAGMAGAGRGAGAADVADRRAGPGVRVRDRVPRERRGPEALRGPGDRAGHAGGDRVRRGRARG
ncbi:hypothetical protein FKR81_22665 [Lentzea tibetensis]|uniref:Uncharacterized protein n=1 Tax=Lentzea tibetensis TaxID=2591470 RepID=A0A563EQT2_9PSEU|nr:hypothetical protein FKR81_22665 [Lentzea tibetensis]